jgi:dihydroflavonol-4-reductase
MRIAVTGASGHIGNCLVRELLASGNQVSVFVHRSDFGLGKLGVEILKGDILDPDTVDKFCRGVDIVYHLAVRISIDNKEHDLVYRNNVKGTENVIHACLKNKVRRMVHFSSIHAYQAFPLDRVLDESRPLVDRADMIYDISKADSERMVAEAAKKDIDAVIVNPTAVIGPFDFKGSYLGQALKKIYRNKLPMLVKGGYDWVDVRDVVQGAIAAAEKGRRGESYLLSGHYYTLVELSEMIGKVTGRKTPKHAVPMFAARIGRPFVALYALLKREHPLYTKESLSVLKNSPVKISSEKASKELDYHPRSLEETLKDTFAWYKEQGLIE